MIRAVIVDDHPVISEGLFRILSAETDIELAGLPRMSSMRWPWSNAIGPMSC